MHGALTSAAAIAGLLCAAGCSSVPPPRYFTLDMAPSGQAAPKKRNLAVERLRLTEALLRESILIRTSPTEAEYYAACAWLSGVDALVREKLEAEFGPDLPDRPTVAVRGTVLAFEQVDLPESDRAEGHIKLECEFREPELGGKLLLRRTYELSSPAEKAEAAAVARALSAGLAQIARQIAADADAIE